MTIRTKLLFQNFDKCPLGRITSVGFTKNNLGICDPTMRILGGYAITYLLAGAGHFRDDRGFEQAVKPGDLMLLFPEIAHHYSPDPGQHFDDFYLVFLGPIFDVWRQEGLLNPAMPIYHLEPTDYWVHRFQEVISPAPRIGPKQSVEAICRLQVVLADALRAGQPEAAKEAGAWLPRACRQLEANLHEPLYFENVARQLGMPYDRFRKQFTQLTGVTPGMYRMTRVIDRACELMLTGGLTTREIAEQLGFCDEFHFSRRFKQITGKSPSQFRRMWKR